MVSAFYIEYLHSQEWRDRRQAKLQEVENRCQHCPETEYLSVHHLTYERLGCEDTRDMLVLCQSCHWVADELRKNPNSTLWREIREPGRIKHIVKTQTKKDKTERKTSRQNRHLSNKERRHLRNARRLEERKRKKAERISHEYQQNCYR